MVGLASQLAPDRPLWRTPLVAVSQVVEESEQASGAGGLGEISGLLERYERSDDVTMGERAVIARMRDFATLGPACFRRELSDGHFTASALVVHGGGDAVLLAHHRKLNLWLQPGGHADGDTDLLRVALREAREETGLNLLRPVTSDIFDVDIHEIPERRGEPRHLHYDVRFLLIAPGDQAPRANPESFDVRWVPLRDLERIASDPSVQRLAKKWCAKVAREPAFALVKARSETTRSVVGPKTPL